MKTARGFTLVELMVTVVVIAILTAVAAPSYNAWLRKLEVRNAAEAVLHGLQLARAEAIKRNGATSIALTGGDGWTLADGNGAAIQSRPSGEGSRAASLTVTEPASATPYTVSFNSLGQMLLPGVPVRLSAVDVAGADCTSAGPMNCLVIEIGAGGLTRMCDPSPAKNGSPQAC